MTLPSKSPPVIISANNNKCSGCCTQYSQFHTDVDNFGQPPYWIFATHTHQTTHYSFSANSLHSPVLLPTAHCNKSRDCTYGPTVKALPLACSVQLPVTLLLIFLRNLSPMCNYDVIHKTGSIQHIATPEDRATAVAKQHNNLVRRYARVPTDEHTNRQPRWSQYILPRAE